MQGFWSVIGDFWGVYGLRIIKAAVIFSVGYIVARMLAAGLRRLLAKTKSNIALTVFLGRAAYFLMLAIVFIAALGALGVETTSMVAVLGVAGLAISFALQAVLGNFASGIIITTLRAFNIGDYVTIAGESGTIEDIQFFNTQMRTLDNRVMYIPNSKITDSVIINFSARNTRRLELNITVSHDSDIEKAQQIVRSLLAADPRIHEDPVPLLGLLELNEVGAVLTIRPWVNRADLFQVQFDLLGSIKKEFDSQGISFGRLRREVLLQQQQ